MQIQSRPSGQPGPKSKKDWSAVSDREVYKQHEKSGAPTWGHDVLAHWLLTGSNPPQITEFQHRTERLTEAHTAGEMAGQLRALRNKKVGDAGILGTISLASLVTTALSVCYGSQPLLVGLPAVAALWFGGKTVYRSTEALQAHKLANQTESLAKRSLLSEFD